jgi:hypothetical protein
MNFTSFRVYFHIKNQISNSFNQIKIALTGRTITEEGRGLGVNVHMTQTDLGADGRSNIGI